MDRLNRFKLACLLLLVPVFFAGCAAGRYGQQQNDLPIWSGQGISDNLSRTNPSRQATNRSTLAQTKLRQQHSVSTPESRQGASRVKQNALASSTHYSHTQRVDAGNNNPAANQSPIKTVSYIQEQDPVVRAQDPGYIPPVTLQDPNAGGTDPYTTQGTYQNGPIVQGGPIISSGQQPTNRTGAPNEPVPGYFQVPPGGNTFATPNFADIDIGLSETQTGRITFGAAFNSDSGIVGQIIIDERNFDIGAFPRNLGEVIDGTAWRGAGQGFRLELVPGDEVQRYMVSFTEPYLFNTAVSFSASGYFFDRQFFDWEEQRLGGRFSLGYRLTPDLSVNVGTRLEQVQIREPRVNTSAELNAALGDSNLFVGNVSLIHDTRDHPFMASEGSYLELSFHQAFGDFSYPRGDLDYRRYFLIYQRPDFSGRHTLSFGTRVGISGNDTPIFENYQAGGFSTMRGFDFRGASPLEGGVRVGGEFQWLNSVEYTFPITADDMIKGVFFCDFGTVEQDIEINSDNFRVAPGFGFRIHMPVGGAGGAPLAFDFAFPVAQAATDDEQVFSFYLGVLR